MRAVGLIKFLLCGILALASAPVAADKVATDQYTLNAQLVSAARRGDEGLARQTLERGAAVNTRNRGGNTALMLFTEQGNRSMVELLLERGADVDLPN
ncbi:MAG: ankyrin repeat domain-containing protein, partial [Betaproteobacteria bacterium]|nr:ankyrin repeat domain-containing protein [Betaproteobacteria bacterium]